MDLQACLGQGRVRVRVSLRLDLQSADMVVPVQGGFLDDVQRLDLDAMAWAPPPAVGGAAPGAPRRAAGHSLAGLLAFGGCTPTPHGVMPIARTDLLLLGARRPRGTEQCAAACMRAALPRGPDGCCSVRSHLARVRLLSAPAHEDQGVAVPGSTQVNEAERGACTCFTRVHGCAGRPRRTAPELVSSGPAPTARLGTAGHSPWEPAHAPAAPARPGLARIGRLGARAAGQDAMSAVAAPFSCKQEAAPGPPGAGAGPVPGPMWRYGYQGPARSVAGLARAPDGLPGAPGAAPGGAARAPTWAGGAAGQAGAAAAGAESCGPAVGRPGKGSEDAWCPGHGGAGAAARDADAPAAGPEGGAAGSWQQVAAHGGARAMALEVQALATALEGSAGGSVRRAAAHAAAGCAPGGAAARSDGLARGSMQPAAPRGAAEGAVGAAGGRATGL